MTGWVFPHHQRVRLGGFETLKHHLPSKTLSTESSNKKQSKNAKHHLNQCDQLVFHVVNQRCPCPCRSLAAVAAALGLYSSAFVGVGMPMGGAYSQADLESWV